MNCFNCGEVVPEGQNFCGNCGAPQIANPDMEPHKPAEGTTRSSSSMTWLWVLLGCGGLLVVTFCLGLVLIFSLVGLLAESGGEVLEQIGTVEPELLDETITQVATLIPLPTVLPTITQVPTQEAQFYCGNLGITTRPWLQVDLACKRVSAQGENELLPAPAFRRIELIDYPVSPAFHEAQVSIYPVDEYRLVNAQAAEHIDQLEELLDSKPERVEQPYPFLPVWNAGQVMAAKFEYIELANGEGVRYLTQYGQAAWPINNEDLFYTFQGLTYDGAYYLSAVLPVTNPQLPPDGDSYIGDDFDGFINAYAEYLDEVEQVLEESASKSFYPRLSDLDATIGSLQVR